MSLEFLSPVVTGDAVPAESPMAGSAERSGARLGVRDGWRIPVAFFDEAHERDAAANSVAFADVSTLPKTELQGPAAALATRAGGLVLGTATPHEGAWWCPITPTRALVVGAQPRAADTEGLQRLDATTQFCGLRIEGPLARPLMARLCALDLRPAVAPPTSLRPGSVARTPGVVVVEGPDQLLVLVGAAFAQYLWTVVSDAAGRLGGRPVRADVLRGAPRDREEATTGA